MFCKWCGKKLPTIGTLCPSCGKEQPPLESGTGFWDLCDGKGSGKSIAEAHQTKPSAVTEEPSSVMTKKKKNARAGFVVLVAALILSLISAIGVLVVFFQGSNANSELSSLHSSVSSLRQTTNEKFDSINNQLAALDGLSEKIDIIAQPKKTDEQETEPPIQPDPGNSITNPESDPMSEKIAFDDSELKTSDDLSVIRYKSASEDLLIFTATGEMLQSDDAIILWQISKDNGLSWETVAENDPLITVDEPDIRVAEYFVSLDEQKLSQDSPFSDCITSHDIEGEEGMTYYSVAGTLLSSPKITYKWQCCNLYGIWNDLHCLPVCVVPAAEIDQYRLAIYSEEFYCAEWSEEETDTDAGESSEEDDGNSTEETENPSEDSSLSSDETEETTSQIPTRDNTALKQ